jgi:hypothetical protein
MLGLGKWDMTRDIFGRLLRADRFYPAQHGRGQGSIEERGREFPFGL